jgi:gp40|nr:MAG TPA: putative protease [Caudoviricetes sp.]
MSEENAMPDSGQTDLAATPPDVAAPPPTEAAPPPTQPETNATGGEKAQADTPPEPYALDFGVYGENVDAGEAQFLSQIAQESGADAASASKLVQDLTLYGQVKHDLQVQDWEAASRADPEFGGEKLAENLAIANRVFEAYDPQGIIRGLLQETGYGNHPDLIRFMLAIGRDLSPDRMVSASGASGLDARAFFPNSNMNP